jgi:hypothetical protein
MSNNPNTVKSLEFVLQWKSFPLNKSKLCFKLIIQYIFNIQLFSIIFIIFFILYLYRFDYWNWSDTPGSVYWTGYLCVQTKKTSQTNKNGRCTQCTYIEMQNEWNIDSWIIIMTLKFVVIQRRYNFFTRYT